MRDPDIGTDRDRRATDRDRASVACAPRKREVGAGAALAMTRAMEAFRRFAGILAVLCGAGCPMYQVKTKPVMEGAVETVGVEIWAADSSFRLEGGKGFATPFFASQCVHSANVNNHELAARMGARPVVVKVPELSRPLYGLLAFCKVPDEATDPASRSYLVRVPASYVEATEGNRVSVVAEPTSFHDFPAWQLWLSRTPALWP
jgi:hypothetical protein